MPLTVSLRSNISPRTSTVIFFVKSPPATAFVTAVIERTWSVKFMAIRFTLFVKIYVIRKKQQSAKRRVIDMFASVIKLLC